MKNYCVKKTTALFAEDINWKQIEGMDLTSNCGDGKVPYKTKCYLAWNNAGIFYRFEVEDDKINCTMTDYNSPIYNEETVELFIQPTEDKTHYMEFEWNAIGGVFCAEVNNINGKCELDFVKENIIDSKVYASSFGWIVQGMLPAKLFKAQFGGEWKFNSYRIKLAQDKSQILLSYSNTIKDNYHIPDKFATLKFED